MKKIVLLISVLILMTGCESTITYSFDNNIESEINFTFNLNEYRNFASLNYGNDFDKESDDILRGSIDYNSNKLNAFVQNENIFYNKKYYSSDGYSYTGQYIYSYNYDNFKDNFFLNMCFDNFVSYEDDRAYYYRITGDSKCSNSKIIVGAKNKIIDSNSKNVSNEKHIWNVNEKNNDIYFSISKNEISKKGISILHIVYLIFALIIGIVAIFLNKKFKRNN